MRQSMDEIARDCTQQRHGIVRIGQTMPETNTTTQQNAMLIGSRLVTRSSDART
ncbi:hypothetical protein KXR87_11385 [Yokenella regensburgei]|uniref:hypothetical protein n=1 Tax=Yokenella regensburgei TaxID=158877 RepID=UPI003F163F06